MKDTKWYQFKDFKDMTTEQQEEYKKCKWEIISNYMGVPVTSADSLRLRTQAFLEETKTGFWD